MKHLKIRLIIILCLVCIAVILIVISINNSTRYSEKKEIDYSNVRNSIHNEIPLSSNHYSIDSIHSVGDYIYAVVNTFPDIGQGSIVLYVLGGDFAVIESFSGAPPISLGVAAYKLEHHNATIVFGAVNDQVWVNPNEAPVKVNYSEVKVLDSQENEQSMKVNNHQAFMFCLDVNIVIDKLMFISGSEIVYELSSIPAVQ